jgi:hypothetical protein
MDIHPSNFVVNYDGLLKDVRLERRGKKLWNSLSLTPCSSIRRISSTAAEQRANLRFLNNERVTEQALTEEASRRMAKLSEGRHLLCIQDTCEISLLAHQGRLKPDSGLGRSDNSEAGDCFKLHPGLVLDAPTMNPLGFSHIKVFHRPDQMPLKNQRNYSRQPIEDKESYKWLEVAQASKQVLQTAASVTFIEDREGDIYEQFARIPEGSVHLLIRSRSNRKLSNGTTLYEQVASQAVAGTYTVNVPTDKRKGQYRRKATLELRFMKCEIQCPANLRSKGYPSSLPVTCIAVKEIDSAAANPIDWKLLTTHSIDDFSQALQMVQWYSSRWNIEQLFRLMKKQGFGIESTQLESGWSIRKLAVMQLTAVLKILQMHIAYNQPEGGQPIEEVFDGEQIEALHLLNARLQGKTLKQQNRNDPAKTKWATWIVARLGGWKGYDSQGPPGVIVLKRGLNRLTYVIEGINLKKDVYTR